MAEQLEHLAAVRKVAGSNLTRTIWKTLDCSPSSEGYLSLGKVYVAKGDDWALPFTCHSPRQDRGLTSRRNKVRI